MPSGDAPMYVLLGPGAKSARGRNRSATLVYSESWAATTICCLAYDSEISRRGLRRGSVGSIKDGNGREERREW